MNARIQELAEQAGLLPLWVCVNESTGSQMIKPIDQDVIERFVELVRQDEREACAKLCDDWLVGRDDICEVAAAIRARGEI